MDVALSGGENHARPGWERGNLAAGQDGEGRERAPHAQCSSDVTDGTCVVQSSHEVDTTDKTMQADFSGPETQSVFTTMGKGYHVSSSITRGGGYVYKGGSHMSPLPIHILYQRSTCVVIS